MLNLKGLTGKYGRLFAKSSFRVAITLNTLVFIACYVLTGCCRWGEDATLQAGDKDAHDEFGGSVAVNGSRAIIGAFSKDAAYIFERDGSGSWHEAVKLQSTLEAGGEFGNSVSIDGNRAIIGAIYEDYDQGAAYIFERDGSGSWLEAAKLLSSDIEEDDRFGVSVSISGDVAIVGAKYGGTDGYPTYDEEGAAYLFERDGSGSWLEMAKIQASDKKIDDLFGQSVAISEDRVIVGAPGENTSGDGTGAVYFFERDGGGSWHEVAKIQASDKEAEDRFGGSVAISGNRAIVGASGEDTGGNSTGAAYVFERAGTGAWVEVAKVQADDKEAFDYFGVSVSISGNRAIVGASGEDTGGSGTGAVYLFERTGSGAWHEKAKWQASDKQVNDYFGKSVAISGKRVIVGASGEDTGGSNAGAAYLFECQCRWW